MDDVFWKSCRGDSQLSTILRVRQWGPSNSAVCVCLGVCVCVCVTEKSVILVTEIFTLLTVFIRHFSLLK